MTNCKRISDIESHEAQTKIAAAETEADVNRSARDQVAYYIDNGQGERVGTCFDIQNSVPKSVSLLAAFGDGAMREKVFGSHHRAFRRALDLIFDDGLIDPRHGKAGRGPHNPPDEVAAAVHRRFASRAKDPQLLIHPVIVNAPVRAT